MRGLLSMVEYRRLTSFISLGTSSSPMWWAWWDVQPHWKFCIGEHQELDFITGSVYPSQLTSNQAWLTPFQNRILLCTSSMVMGGIGIWCMHFIGNRAIVIGDGAEENQIIYNGGFTGFSFLLPVMIIFLAFYAVSSGEKAGYIRILTGGILTGSSVCGMHYVGQLGIKNYACTYNAVNIVLSAAIAIFSSTIALGNFFRWRATWTNNWWRRGACACLLAAAISGMHWTATVGTRYHENNRSTTHYAQRSRSQVVIVCTVLVRLDM